MHDWIVADGINLLDHESFVYRIWDIRSGRAYIGAKIVYARRKGKRVVSDYLKYWGSSDELKDKIAKDGLVNFRREVLHVCRTRQEALYQEAKELFARDALTATLPSGERAFYNSNIARQFFAARGSFQLEKKAYAAKPKVCVCGSVIKFAKRHTGHCSVRCQRTSEKDK